jgi:hypothetical protein
VSLALRVRIGRGTLRAERLRRGAVVWAAEAGYGGPDEVEAAMVELLAEEGGRGARRILVELDPPVVQVRTLTGLPPVRGRQLGALLAHQAGRFFRKNGHPLVTDIVWAGRRGGAAYAAAVDSALVEAVLRGAAQAGGIVEAVVPATANGHRRLSLLPGPERGARDREARRQLRRLGAVAVGLWIALGAGLAIRQVRTARDLERRLTTLRAPVAAVLEAERRMSDVQRMTDAIERDDRAGGQMARLLVRLTSVLPDSAFIASIALQPDGAGSLSGAARRPADVLVRIERAGLVSRPHFVGQGLRELMNGREMEHFTIAFGPAGSP